MKLSNEHLVPQIVFQDHCMQFSTEREVGISRGAAEGKLPLTLSVMYSNKQTTTYAEDGSWNLSRT